MHSLRPRASATVSVRRSAIIRRTRSLCAVGLLLACVVATGCQTAQLVSVRDTPAVPLMSKLNFASSSGPKPTQRTLQTLRKFGLEEMALDEPAEALTRLEKFIQQEPELDTIIA
jgi:hypothetical protein